MTVDTLIGAALSLLAVGTLFSFSQMQQRALATQTTYAQAQTVTRTVVDLLSRELRMATYRRPVGTCGFNGGIVQATPTSIRFQQDLNGDGAVTAAGEDVAWVFQNGQITRQDLGTGAAAVPLVDAVPENGFRLRYFNAASPAVELLPTGSPAALSASDRDCVTKVVFTVAAQLPNPNPQNPRPLTSATGTEVVIRNRSLVNY